MRSLVNTHMSRIGKKIILIPEGVEVKIEGQKVTVKGPKGELSREFRPELGIEAKDNQIKVSSVKEGKKTRALWGLTRQLLANMVQGVTKGYEKKLEIEGVGYKAALDGNDLVLQVGFTHPVRIKATEGIKILVEKNVISVSGIDKEVVGQVAANIRKVKPPEPYKGKGIRYAGEHVRRKIGKRAATTA